MPMRGAAAIETAQAVMVTPNRTAQPLPTGLSVSSTRSRASTLLVTNLRRPGAGAHGLIDPQLFAHLRVAEGVHEVHHVPERITAESVVSLHAGAVDSRMDAIVHVD